MASCGRTTDRGRGLRLVHVNRDAADRVRARLGIVLVTTAALLFSLVNQNDADIDSAANALAFAALALGLNIVVGFAGLLDLGYAAFFTIGAYAYGVASSWQLQPQV
jgi:branched-chain amino acid transport system permease protein